MGEKWGQFKWGTPGHLATLNSPPPQLTSLLEEGVLWTSTVLYLYHFSPHCRWTQWLRQLPACCRTGAEYKAGGKSFLTKRVYMGFKHYWLAMLEPKLGVCLPETRFVGSHSPCCFKPKLNSSPYLGTKHKMSEVPYRAGIVDQLVRVLVSHVWSPVFVFISLHKLGVVVHACSLCTWEVEAGGCEGLGHFW